MEDNISQKWINYGLKNEQEIIDEINRAYEVKEKLDSNIYIGKSTKGTICMCLDGNNKIELAFPVHTTKNDYLKIKEQVKEIIGDNDLNVQVISLFIAIDITNNKELLKKEINDLPKEYNFDLFSCLIDEELTVITMELGQIVIGTEYIKNYLLNSLLI